MKRDYLHIHQKEKCLSIYSFRVELCFMRVVLSFGTVPALFNMLLSIFLL